MGILGLAESAREAEDLIFRLKKKNKELQSFYDSTILIIIKIHSGSELTEDEKAFIKREVTLYNDLEEFRQQLDKLSDQLFDDILMATIEKENKEKIG